MMGQGSTPGAGPVGGAGAAGATPAGFPAFGSGGSGAWFLCGGSSAGCREALKLHASSSRLVAPAGGSALGAVQGK